MQSIILNLNLEAPKVQQIRLCNSTRLDNIFCKRSVTEKYFLTSKFDLGSPLNVQSYISLRVMSHGQLVTGISQKSSIDNKCCMCRS